MGTEEDALNLVEWNIPIKGENTAPKKAYLLSPKDHVLNWWCRRNNKKWNSIFKSRGEEMKRPEYVSGVVDTYRRAIDKVIYKQKFDLKKGRIQLTQII